MSLTSIKDETLRPPLSFKDWLEEFVGDDEPTHEFGMLIEMLAPAPEKYDFKSYVTLIPEKHLDLYIRAESAWKIDLAAKSSTKKHLGLDVTSPEGLMLRAISCGYRNRGGHLCGREVVPGVDRCTRHGGALVDPEVRRSILLSAYANIVEGAEIAVSALLDVAENGRSEMARVQASKELLDRAGLTADTTINIKISAEVDAGAILRDRLDTMSSKIIDIIDVEPIEDAEVVEDAKES